MQSDWLTDFEPQFSFLPQDGERDGGWTPSGCCSRRGSFRPRAACQQRSTSAGPGDALLVLDLGLHILDGVRGLDFEGDGLACEGLHEDLHTSPKTENEMEGGLLLDVVVGEGPSVLELLASKDQPLLVRGDALLVLDLGLHILDGVRGLDLEGKQLEDGRTLS